MITLRDYQEAAARAALDSIGSGHAPALSLPTGSGKGILIAHLAHIGRGRVLVVTDRQELIKQNEAKLLGLAPGADVGVYSAGLERRESDAKVVMGGIQSIYNRMDELQRVGDFSAVIVDECHKVNHDNNLKIGQGTGKTMYRQMFEACTEAKRIGLSATCSRLVGGPIYKGPHAWFDDLAYHVGVRELTPKYLAPLIGVETSVEISTKGLHKSGGDWATKELSERMSEPGVVKEAMSEIMTHTPGREHWLVFCVDKAHAELMAKELQMRDVDARLLLSGSGKAYQLYRKNTIEAFENGQFRALVGVGIFTTGFDVACVDAIIMARKTESRELVIQIFGRGTRQSEGKENCLVLDLGGNIESHAPLDGLDDRVKTPARVEKDAKKEMYARRREEKERRARHGSTAYRGDIWADAPARELRVLFITYALLPSKNASYLGKTNVAARYVCTDEDGVRAWVTQWLCVEYPPGGRAAKAAAEWFKRRGHGMPTIAGHALNVAKSSRRPVRITVRHEKGYDRIVEEVF